MDHKGEDWKIRVIWHRSNEENNTFVRDSCNNTECFLFLFDTYVQESRDKLLLSTEHLYPNHGNRVTHLHSLGEILVKDRIYRHDKTAPYGGPIL